MNRYRPGSSAMVDSEKVTEDMFNAPLARLVRRRAPASAISAAGQTTTENERETLRDGFFDNAARTLASPVPRRGVLKMALAGLASAALAGLGVKTSRAAENCLCAGQIYNPTMACCTPTGVQPKHPVVKLSACPHKVGHPGHQCMPNGCGPPGLPVPNRFGAANFRPCCNNHDCCYSKCNEDKIACDNAFLSCLVSACLSAYGSGIKIINLKSCLEAAGTYYAFVFSLGLPFYTTGQRHACDCCGDEPCPQTCPGGFCGALPPCEGGFDCVCFTSVDGNGVCAHGLTPCASVPTCSSTADCPPGWVCLNTTCCGSHGVCAGGPVLCNPITPAPLGPSLMPESQTGVPTFGGYR